MTVACNPASGSSFPLGMSSVACIVTDALSREASCSFTVSLTGNTLGAKIFDAVGDSLTEGENGHISVLDIPNAYPTRLQAALEATYPGQGIKVVNRGVSGYPVDRTVEEIPGDLSRDQPDAVLLLSGYNNLLVECGGGPANTADCRDAIDAVRFGIRDCIRRSREGPSAARYTFVSTLTPPGPVSGARDRHISNDAVMQANDRIRQVVGAEGAVLVDTYAAFAGHEPEYIDSDGLHLTPSGYQALAEAFLAAIKRTVPQTPQATSRGAR